MDESIFWMQTLASQGRVDFRDSRSRVALLLIGALAVGSFLGLVAIAVGQTRMPDPGERTPIVVFVVICAALALLLGAAAVSLFFRLVRGGIALSVTTEGVWIRGRVDSPVPWSSITTISVLTHQHHQYVQLRLTDQEYERHTKAHGAGRLLAGLNRWMLKRSGLWLPNTISAEPTELADWLHSEWSGRRAGSTLGSWSSSSLRPHAPPWYPGSPPGQRSP